MLGIVLCAGPQEKFTKSSKQAETTTSLSNEMDYQLKVKFVP